MAHGITLLRRRFSPRQVPGLTLWLDAADASTLALTGSNVAQWSDKSGLNNHATQASAAQQPLYEAAAMNGRPALTFDTDDLLSAPDIERLDGFSMYVVAKRNTDTGGNQTLLGKYIPDREWAVFIEAGDAVRFQGSTTGAATDIGINSSATIGVGVAGCIHVDWDKSTLRVGMNGAGYGSGAVSVLNNTANTTRLGLTTSSWGLSGSLSEIVYFSRCLTPSEHADMVTHLKQKWSIA